MAREPFTRRQLEYIRETCDRANQVYQRAMSHLDRIGQGGHELREIIRLAENAEQRLGVYLFYYDLDVQKREQLTAPRARPPCCCLRRPK